MIRRVLLQCMSPDLAQGCRLVQRSKVGSYLGYSGCAANAFEKAAPDPIRKLLRCAAAIYNDK
jgi:hypothetical protein